MSFQEEKRESIKRYMLEKIRDDDVEFIQKTAENFGISATTVRRYIKDCLNQKIMEEKGSTACGYTLTTMNSDFSYETAEILSEDQIYFSDIRPVLPKLSKEASNIWSYVFTEMMNNAIEHAEAKHILCHVKSDILYTEISILDDGVGIFQKIMGFLKEKKGMKIGVYDVFGELYKGKLTTNASSHSGEGIFFTSKILEKFAVLSDSTIFSSGCYDREKFVQSHLVAYYTKLQSVGTMVVMKLENETTRSIKEVFDMFAPIDEGFVRTSVPLKEVCPYGEPVARSQARRLLYRMEEFKHVEFDCSEIDFMGQGFADEIFRVFQSQHPEIELLAINTNAAVAGMIQHVKRSS